MSDSETENVNVDFEFHPPIEDDKPAVMNFLRQNIHSLLDIDVITNQVISRKDITLILTMDDSDDIYGVSSIINLGDDAMLLEFFSSKLTKSLSSKTSKPALVISERFTNLPAQLSLPFFRTLKDEIDKRKFTHLIFMCKILMKENVPQDVPRKKSSKKNSDPLIFTNVEEELLWENSEESIDLDMSEFYSEESCWVMGSDAKYAPYRRIISLDANKWTDTITMIEKEISRS